MSFSDVELPSNRKFGIFFSAIFLIVAGYFSLTGSYQTSLFFSLICISFLLITIIKDALLFPLNKMWMKFGLMLGRIVSPLLIALIFFLLITPVALIMRLAGRDELRLRKLETKTFWKLRAIPSISAESFNNQF